MNPKSLGMVIAKLRKQRGLTQFKLAEKLNVSDKAVSRWESGIGFPEVTLFPELAKALGVSVDFLMTGERKGIAIAGSIITDIVKTIDFFPKQGMLANISDIKKAVGGCAPNTAIDLAKIDRTIPLSVIGKIGDDEYGRFILAELSKCGIDCSQVSVSPNNYTSFCDVMSLPSGERTFFHKRGTNADFSPADIDLSRLNCVMLHIGYLMLLDNFDKADDTYGTVMARFLHDVKRQGIKTSVDLISQDTPEYSATVIHSLKYCDYIIVNEVESSMVSGIKAYNEDGSLNTQNIKKTCLFLADKGVSEKVIIHCKQAGFCYDVPSKKFTMVPSLKIPKDKIKGSVGAGDAFCAGALYAIYNGYDDTAMLEFASAAAACNLFSSSSTEGMKSKDEIITLPNIYGRQTI